MANFRQGLAGIASGIDKTAALNMANPNKIKPKTGKASQGVTPDFVNAAAYTEANAMRKAAERSQQMMAAQQQQEGQQGTVAQQMQQGAVGGARQNTAGIAQQMQGVMQNNAAKSKQAQKAMQKMAMQKQKPKPVMQPQGQPRPQQRPPQQGGIGAMMAQQGRPQIPQQQQQMPVRRAAQGGLMRFQSGGPSQIPLGTGMAELKKLLASGLGKAQLERVLEEKQFLGMKNIPELVAFLKRQGEPDLATQVDNMPAQRTAAPSADQLNAQRDLPKAIESIGSPKPTTEKVSTPRDPAAVTSADRQNYRRMNRGPANRNQSQDETDLAILKQRQAVAVKPSMGAPRSAANIDKDAFAAKTAAFDKSQQSLGSGIAALQAKSPEARAENEAGLMAFAAKEDAMLDAEPTGATPGGISGTENADIDAQIAAQQSPAAGAEPTTRDAVMATADTKVDAGTLDINSTPTADKFATKFGLEGIATQDAEAAGTKAYGTVTDKLGLDKDGKFKGKTARQKTAEELKTYDTSPEAQKAQRDAERRAFFANFARTGTAGGGLEALSREKARGRKQGRASILERGQLAVGDETRADTIKTKGLDKMFQSVAEANDAKQAAVTAIASMTETDYKNGRAQLDRELRAKAENNRNLQAALKIVSDIDYKAEAAKLEKAKVDGTVLNYASQRMTELKNAEIEIRAAMKEQLNIDKLQRDAEGEPEGSPKQKALSEAARIVEQQTQLQIGKQAIGIIDLMARIVGEEEAAKLSSLGADDAQALRNVGLTQADSQYMQ